MTKFITCPVTTFRYGRYDITNHPVNIDLVTSIKKGNYTHYPDNVGMTTIEFWFNGNKDDMIRWCFPVKMVKKILRPEDYVYHLGSNRIDKVIDVLDETERDACYDRLMEEFK